MKAGKISEKIEPIAKEALRGVSLKNQEVFLTFVHEFFFNLDLPDIEYKSTKAWVQAVNQLWNLFQVRTAGAIKVRCYNQKFQEHPYPIDRGVIDIVTDDMPFLVDSVLATVHDLALKPELVIHPVMRVQRDSMGQLGSHCAPRSQECQGKPESLIRCELSKAFSYSQMQKVQQDIFQTIQAVKQSNNDCEMMHSMLTESAAQLNLCPLGNDQFDIPAVQEFLNWLNIHRYTFLGALIYDFQSQTAYSQLGVLKNIDREDALSTPFIGISLDEETVHLLQSPEPLIITKTRQKSLVYRRLLMDAMTIKKFSDQGEVTSIYQFVGLFNSRTLAASAYETPLLRQKIDYILKKTGFDASWYNGKAVIEILETLPRDELLQGSPDYLLEISLSILQLQQRNKLRLFLRKEPFSRYFSCLVYIPRDRYSAIIRTNIGNILATELQGTLSSYTVQLADLSLARLHYIISVPEGFAINIHHEALEEKLFQATRTWQDFLENSLESHYGPEKGPEIFETFQKAFSASYQEQFDIAEALQDIIAIQESLFHSSLRVRIQRPGTDNLFTIKIYSPHTPVPLSDITPILERMGLKVLRENVFPVALQPSVWIHMFTIRPQTCINAEYLEPFFSPAFLKICNQELENDHLNRLVLTAGLTWAECALLRAYARYFKQLEKPFSPSYVEDVLNQYPLFVRHLLNLFKAQFDPKILDREQAEMEALNNCKNLLTKTQLNDEDRILRSFFYLIRATVRTNFYLNKPYISLKFSSQSLKEIPIPRPLYEIFVYSPQGEGIHLRGGKVARGGIRWSDRLDDYRREVKDLWKTQMVKNAVVVPVGAKGAFIIKKSSSSQSESESSIHFYKIFMQALLEITDNWVHGHVVAPDQVIRRDEDDPYLVVAADKGTSSFSDHANDLAQAQKFWIGDAFAAGGSTGYDHKKMGITARGVWESVKYHFTRLGLDVSKDPITVIGIGDMSGDVFGNGMLRSRSLKLVAAFNHKHIFLDPNPDPETSYQERLRLFKIPHSTWNDYDRNVLSQGGAIFERHARLISLSPEVCAAFQIEENELTPHMLIQILLKAPVDLLWFGGIGTFLKSTEETSLDIMDRSNDLVRINGCDARARVIAEGANLGCTQKGRIEYALKGGLLNTDAIDNSAGVDCSDHEVNIKILFQELMKSNLLTLPERNRWMEAMTEEVTQLVLENNKEQNRAITKACSPHLLEAHLQLIQDLENLGILDRNLEALPNAKDISRRGSIVLTRPELCVLLAYSKTRLFQELISTPFSQDPFLEGLLHQYFPSSLREKFGSFISQHPLRNEIIATIVSNQIINLSGPTFIYEILNFTEKPLNHIVKAFFVAKTLLIEDQNTVDVEELRALLLWFLEHSDLSEDIPTLYQRYRANFQELRPLITDPSSLAHVVQCAMNTQVLASRVAHLYNIIHEALGVHDITEFISTLPTVKSCQRQARWTLLTAVRQTQRSLTEKLINFDESQQLLSLQTQLRPYKEFFQQARTQSAGEWSVSFLLLSKLSDAAQEEFINCLPCS